MSTELPIGSRVQTTDSSVLPGPIEVPTGATGVTITNLDSEGFVHVRLDEPWDGSVRVHEYMIRLCPPGERSIILARDCPEYEIGCEVVILDNEPRGSCGNVSGARCTITDVRRAGPGSVTTGDLYLVHSTQWTHPFWIHTSLLRVHPFFKLHDKVCLAEARQGYPVGDEWTTKPDRVGIITEIDPSFRRDPEFHSAYVEFLNQEKNGWCRLDDLLLLPQ